MESLKKQLIRQATEKGICKQGLAYMEANTTSALISYYLQNPTWCLERDFPDVRMVRRNFGNIRNRGVYVDKDFDGELLNEKQVYILHHCTGTLRTGLNVKKGIIPMFYIANGCDVTIEGGGAAHPDIESVVPVDIYGDCKVKANDSPGVRFRVERKEVSK